MILACFYLSKTIVIYEKLDAKDCGQPTFTSSKFLDCALDEVLINSLESNSK